MLPPLAVWAGIRLNVPQFPAVPQLALQSTPAVLASLATVAFNVACAPIDMVAPGPLESVTAIGAVVRMVPTELAVCVVSAVDVAVTVTVLLVGTEDGAT
jgi:hypothetical protein